MSGSDTHLGERVVCTGCPLVCDDILLWATDGSSTRAEARFDHACARGEAWLSQAWAALDDAGRRAAINGRSCLADEAASHAAERLAACRRVLVTGGGDATLEVAVAAANLAERLAAAVDFGGADAASLGGATAATVGRVTADFEELRDRADCVLLWWNDLSATHPRFVERFLKPAPSCGSRRVFVIGPLPVPASNPGWTAVEIPADQAAEAAAMLQQMLAEQFSGKPSRAVQQQPPGDGPWVSSLAEVAEACAKATCAGVVTVPSPADDSGLHAAAISRVVAWLAHRKPAFELPLAATPAGAGTASAAAVATWRYGDAGAIARADRDGGRLAPAEADAGRLLDRGEVDGVLVVGEPTATVAAALARFDGAVVAVGGPAPAAGAARIWIATAPTSLATSGRLLRGDGRLVELHPVRPSVLPAAEEVLAAIERRCAGEVTR